MDDVEENIRKNRERWEADPRGSYAYWTIQKSAKSVWPAIENDHKNCSQQTCHIGHHFDQAQAACDYSDALAKSEQQAMSDWMFETAPASGGDAWGTDEKPTEDAWGAAEDKKKSTKDGDDTWDGAQGAVDAWGTNDTNDSGAWKDAGSEHGDDAGLTARSGNVGTTKPVKTSAVAAENVTKIQQSGWVKKNDKTDEKPATGASIDGEVMADKPAKDQVVSDGNEDGFEADRPEFASNAVKYEWKDEYGDVAPEIPALEKQLYDDKFLNRVGDAFANMTVNNVSVTVESEAAIAPVFKWEDAGLHPVMLDNVKKCKYDQPTAIQSYCVPAVLTGHDVIAVSQTGSGKTAAYLVPALSRLMGKIKKLGAGRPKNRNEPGYSALVDGIRAEPLVLILVPTRELACQVFDESRRLCYRSMLRPCVVYGGGPSRDQIDDIRNACDLLIATPGRLIDFLNRPGLISLHRVRFTIIDEADELVLPEWEEDMNSILSRPGINLDANHRYMMFSATFPRAARALAKRYLAEDHIRIRVGRTGSAHKHVHQDVIWVEAPLKNQACLDLLLDMPPARTLIFVNSKMTCDLLDDFLYHSGMPSTSIHSGRTQRERESSLRAFRRGSVPIMVATGVSARGLDVFNVMHIINYDLPSVDMGGIHEYVHRIGRTARIGNMGAATSFYNSRNEDIAQDLVNLLVESGQPVPDFLSDLKPPEGEAPTFEDDKSDAEDDNSHDASGDKNGEKDGWGGEADAKDSGDGDGW